jgi:cyanophycin synthetase
MNVYDEHPFKVLFDYGHNAHAVGVMTDLAQRLDVTGRRIVVLAGPGDRRDDDLVAIAHAVAGRFDHYICRRDDSLRDRAPDEVPRLQAAALRAKGVPEQAISIIPDEQEAIDAALRMGQPGDLLLVFADALVRSWKQVTKFRPDGAGVAESAAKSASSGGQGATAAPTAPGSTGAAEPRAGEAQSLAAPELAPVGAGPSLSLEGLIRDERGIRFAPETED